MASLFAVTEDPDRALVDTLAHALGTRSILLVLDNCEQMIEASAELADRLLRSTSAVVLLATSREPLAIDGEQVIRVPPLSLPARGRALGFEEVLRSEAVTLFAERAAGHRQGFVVDRANAPTVAAICSSLDGVPLALELAAARLRSMSLSAI